MDGKWIDVFITKSADVPSTRSTEPGKPASGEIYSYDDEFCCTVQSIQFDPDNGYAYVTERDSPWILPTWTKEYMTSAAAGSPYADIKVGDLVRIGGIETAGFTDYLTVVETKIVTSLYNATSSRLSIALDGISHLNEPTDTTTKDSSNASQVIDTYGIAHIALRLNASLNCTKLDSGVLNNNVTESTHRQEVATGSATRHATLETRHYAYTYLSDNRKAYSGETGGTEKYYYPLYRAKNWSNNKTLVARLDHGVKSVDAVKLVGYSLINKRQVGIQHAHEMHVDDYLIMRIREIEGHVISNNQYVNGAFAVLRAGDTSTNLVGAAEFSAYEPQGIVCVPVKQANNTLRNMTVEITDRMGKPAHFGRLHLWFKLLVTHG